MNRIYAAALALPLALAGCAGVPAGSVSTETNAVACMTALLATGNWDPIALASIAATTPACQALAATILSDIIGQVVPHNAALARAQGRLR